MVHIINGEIVADDDPRVKEKFQPQHQGPTQRYHGIRSNISTSRPSSPPSFRPSPLQNIALTLGLDGTIMIPAMSGFPPRSIQKIHIAIAVILMFVLGWRALIFIAMTFLLTAPPRVQQ